MILQEHSLTEILTIVQEHPTVLFLCPNYEERSVAFPNIIRDKALNVEDIQIYPEVFYLQNEIENSAILDALKYQQFKELQKSFLLAKNCYHRINFPDNFSSAELHSTITSCLERYLQSSESFHIIVDISAMPRSIILEFCSAITALKETPVFQNVVNRIFFVYISPKSYSNVGFSQDIGLPYGFFSGEPLYKNNCPLVHSIIFPGREGHESTLVLNSLTTGCIEHHSTIYFMIESLQYLDSLRFMRANMSILNSHNSTEEYYCSLSDGIRTLSERLDAELVALYRNGLSESSLYVIAPLYSKIMLPAAYYLLTKMKRIFPKVHVEISIMKGFQYVSSYSLGVGATHVYELNQEEFNAPPKMGQGPQETG